MHMQSLSSIPTVNPGPCFGSANGRVNLRAVGGIAPIKV